MPEFVWYLWTVVDVELGDFDWVLVFADDLVTEYSVRGEDARAGQAPNPSLAGC